MTVMREEKEDIKTTTEREGERKREREEKGRESEKQRELRKRRERLEEEAEADKNILHLDAQLHSTQPTLASTIFFIWNISTLLKSATASLAILSTLLSFTFP